MNSIICIWEKFSKAESAKLLITGQKDSISKIAIVNIDNQLQCKIEDELQIEFDRIEIVGNQLAI